MNHLEYELQGLKSQVVEMWKLVSEQMRDAMVMLATMDQEKAKKISETEKKVNFLDLKIDRDCENIFALYNPVASDLRLVLALLRINYNLERIGDAAYSIAKFVKKDTAFDNAAMIDKIGALRMFDEACDLLDDVFTSFINENAQQAENIIKRDKALNELDKQARAVIIESIKKDPEHVEDYLALLSVARKLERAGDQCKNIATEIIFFVEAKVLKHIKD
jgi:phosphate transport system protein